MDYAQALASIDARVPTRMVPNLDRMRALSELLNHPERTYPTIHITGTNGKTTTAQVATQILRALGLRVGTYTSPHLHSVRERICYDGDPISEDEFAEMLDYLTPFLERVDGRGERVTWFETLTIMAELWFAERAVDVAVVEVGMGGEWDATNLVDGRVAVITEVALDHPELGSTPAEVAREKVGIIKDEAVCVTGEGSADVLAVIKERCAARRATLRLAGEDFDIADRRLAFGGQVLDIRAGERTYAEVLLPLYGERLATDGVLGLVAVAALFGDREIEDDILREAFASVRVPGRVEVLRRHPLVVADGAHNPDAAKSLVHALSESFRWDRCVLVLGMLADKDLAGVAEVLVPGADEVIVTRAHAERAAPIERLAKEVERFGREPQTAATVAGAAGRALELATETDLVLVTGSFYTVAEAREALFGVARDPNVS